MSNLRSRLESSSIRLGFGTAILVLAAACGSSAPATSAVGGSSAPGATATTATGSSAPSAPASSPAVSGPATTSAPSVPAILGSHADPALEALLPTSIGGTGLAVSSLTLKAVLDAGGDRPAIDAFLASIGKSEADGSVAFAVDLSGAVPGGISAFKITGADAATLLGGIVALQRGDLGSGATATPAKVGGKSVTVVSIGNGVNDNAWIYGHGDVVFVVKAPDEASAMAYLTVLP